MFLEEFAKMFFVDFVLPTFIRLVPIYLLSSGGLSICSLLLDADGLEGAGSKNQLRKDEQSDRSKILRRPNLRGILN